MPRKNAKQVIRQLTPAFQLLLVQQVFGAPSSFSSIPLQQKQDRLFDLHVGHPLKAQSEAQQHRSDPPNPLQTPMDPPHN